MRVVLLDADEVRQIVKTFGGKYLAFKVVVEPPRPTARARKLMKDAGDGSASGKPDREETTLIVALAPSRPGTE